MSVRGVLVAGVAVLVLGCGGSSTNGGGVKTGPEMSSQTGAGGQGGASDAGSSTTGAVDSGGGGAGGAPAGGSGFTGFPDGEVPDCSVLVTQYAQTIAGAQSCDIDGSGQCQQMVDETLSACPSCQTYVNDAAIVNSIKQNWMQIGCASTPASGCPPVSCPPANGASCVASSSGGTCTAK